ncbi:kinase-like domain-containing protein [Pilaira anomala]|nr:kinase-like domain-containing protein [Pilaira anomala]
MTTSLPEHEVLGYLRGANDYSQNFCTPLPVNKIYRIGSSRKCDIIIDLDYISPFHCVIRAEAEEFRYVKVYLTDLSLNGTYLNGELIGYNQTVILYPSSVISFVSKHLNLYYIPVYSKSVRSELEDNAYEEDFMAPLYPKGHKKHCMISVTKRVVGKGQQSYVLLCNVEKRLRVQLAVKERHPQNIFGRGKALETELKILKNNKHQNVLSAISSFNRDHKSYSFTPLYYGGTLSERIKKHNPIEEKDIFFIFSQISSGLNYLHKNGIIHCDLKPDNILLENDAKRTRVIIADFGLVIERKEVNDWPNEYGTLAYRAPEVLLPEAQTHKPFNQKVDIWALGIIVFEMFTKKHPFFHKDGPTTRLSILTKEPDMSIFINTSTEAKNLILALLSKDPSTRSPDECYGLWAQIHADNYFYQDMLRVQKDFARERYMWFEGELGATDDVLLRPLYHPDQDETATECMISRMKLPLTHPNYLLKRNKRFAGIETGGPDHTLFLNEERYPERTLLKKRLSDYPTILSDENDSL